MQMSCLLFFSFFSDPIWASVNFCVCLCPKCVGKSKAADLKEIIVSKIAMCGFLERVILIL